MCTRFMFELDNEIGLPRPRAHRHYVIALSNRRTWYALRFSTCLHMGTALWLLLVCRIPTYQITQASTT